MIEPRKCGHTFVQAKTCDECKRWLEEVQASKDTKTVSVRPTHGLGH